MLFSSIQAKNTYESIKAADIHTQYDDCLPFPKSHLLRLDLVMSLCMYQKYLYVPYCRMHILSSPIHSHTHILDSTIFQRIELNK